MLWIAFSLAVSIKENIPSLKEIHLLENHFRKVEGLRRLDDDDYKKN
jgi:hypothetical protein